jgi:hypothetical protein
MTEGSRAGAGCVPNTNGSGSGRPKNHTNPTDPDPQHWCNDTSYEIRRRVRKYTTLTELEADSNSVSSRSGTPSVFSTDDVSNEAREPRIEFLCIPNFQESSIQKDLSGYLYTVP